MGEIYDFPSTLTTVRNVLNMQTFSICKRISLVLRAMKMLNESIGKTFFLWLVTF